MIIGVSASQFIIPVTPPGGVMEEFIYRATFPNSTGIDINDTLSRGWKVLRTSNGTNVTATDVARIKATAGAGSTVPINASTAENTSLGHLWGSSTGNRWAAYTEEYIIDRVRYDVKKFSFYSYADANQPFSVIIKIATQWYISNTQFVDPTYNYILQLYELPFTTVASAWSTVAVNPGVGLSIGSTLVSPLPAGNIVGFGIYYRGVPWDIRLDAFEVKAVDLAPPAATPELVFLETFPNPSGVTKGTASIGWVLRIGANAFNTGGSAVRFEPSKTGDPSVSINAGYAAIDESSNGFLFDNNNKDIYLVFTSKYPISRATKQLQKVNYTIGHGATTWLTYFAVRIAGLWYYYNNDPKSVTTIVNNNAAHETSALAVETVFDMALAGGWSTLNYTSGSLLSIGTPLGGVLPSGEIEAFGIFGHRPEGLTTLAIRIDSLAITII